MVRREAPDGSHIQHTDIYAICEKCYCRGGTQRRGTKEWGGKAEKRITKIMGVDGAWVKTPGSAGTADAQKVYEETYKKGTTHPYQCQDVGERGRRTCRNNPYAQYRKERNHTLPTRALVPTVGKWERV